MGNIRDDRLVKKLIDAVFYTKCEIHETALSGKLKFFCLTCGGIAICPLCRKSNTHSAHNIIETFICSHFPTLRPESVEGWIDVSGICQFKINKHDVVFIKSNPDKNKPKGVVFNKSNQYKNKPKGACCKICFRPLLDQKSISFCSIKCKIEGLEKEEEQRQKESNDKQTERAEKEEEQRQEESNDKQIEGAKKEEEQKHEQSNYNLRDQTNELQHANNLERINKLMLRKRKRKSCKTMLREELEKRVLLGCKNFKKHPRKQDHPQRAPLF